MSDKTIKIMVIDDQAVVRQGFVALINTVSDMAVVAEGTNGQQAIDLYRLHRPDVTLMDLRMPQMGGVEAIVKSHINSILSKLGVSDRTQAATTALQRGLVHLR